MKYKKIKPISLSENSAINLLLRQQWAIEFLRIMKTEKTIINVDESWINQTNFTRMKWQVKGTTNSMPVKGVAPRISMIMAMFSNGLVLGCLT